MLVSLVAGLLAAAQPSGDSTIQITTYPARPLIERGVGINYLNFDFGLVNTGAAPREIRLIELSVFDRDDRLVHRQFISATGAASPALRTIPERIVPATGALGLFNPFYALPSHLPLDRLRFEFVFETRGIEPVVSATIDVRPRADRPVTRLALPVDGPALVYDGHDFYSHHRRIPLGGELARRVGRAANPVRYANDWSPVGPAGELARGSLATPTNWYAYGALVRAPAAGVVVSASNDVPDNRIEDGKLVMAPGLTGDDLRASLGNHLIIRHRDGEYSLLAHLGLGTVRAAVGDSVRRNQIVGAIGFSGDTGFHVHLHHMLMTENALSAEGLPAYFDRVRRVSMRAGPRPYGPILMGVTLDTGDLVVSASAGRN